MRIREPFAALCAVFLLAACDAGTVVEEAELESGTEEMTIAESEPTDTWGTDTTGGSAFEQATLADLDADRDQQVDRDEYDAWFDRQVWSEWDGDGDGRVTQSELGEIAWGWWDTDGDGFVDQQEYAAGRETFTFEGVDYADFDEVAGDDGRLERAEFDTWFAEHTWSTWADDSDHLERDAAADTFWQWWDEDGDERIDSDEIARFGDAEATTVRTEEPRVDLSEG